MKAKILFLAAFLVCLGSSGYAESGQKEEISSGLFKEHQEYAAEHGNEIRERAEGIMAKHRGYRKMMKQKMREIMDTNGDGRVDQTEKEVFLRRRAEVDKGAIANQPETQFGRRRRCCCGRFSDYSESRAGRAGDQFYRPRMADRRSGYLDRKEEIADRREDIIDREDDKLKAERLLDLKERLKGSTEPSEKAKLKNEIKRLKSNIRRDKKEDVRDKMEDRHDRMEDWRDRGQKLNRNT